MIYGASNCAKPDDNEWPSKSFSHSCKPFHTAVWKSDKISTDVAHRAISCWSFLHKFGYVHPLSKLFMSSIMSSPPSSSVYHHCWITFDWTSVIFTFHTSKPSHLQLFPNHHPQLLVPILTIHFSLFCQQGTLISIGILRNNKPCYQSYCQSVS